MTCGIILAFVKTMAQVTVSIHSDHFLSFSVTCHASGCLPRNRNKRWGISIHHVWEATRMALPCWRRGAWI